MKPARHNAHIHLPPNFSAFDSVEQAVNLAAQQGLVLLGASNYYDYSVYADFAELAREQRVFPLFGLEIICLLDDLQHQGIRLNDPANPGKMYLCGKGISRFQPFSAEAEGLIAKIRHLDSARMASMCRKLDEVFRGHGLSLGLNEASVKQMVADRHHAPLETIYLQERHLCQAAQERFFENVAVDRRAETLTAIYGGASRAAATDAVATQNEIRSKLMKSGKPAYVPETFVNFAEARRLIEALGGIVSYPVLADGVSPVCEFESTPQKLIENLKSRDIHAAEFIPNRNTPDVLSEYVTALHQAGFIVTAGTEHNTLDLIAMAPVCSDGQPIPQDIQEIFWRGACAVAGHQVLGLQGKSDSKRTDELATAGSSAIEAFIQR